jgi:hypothetical protein
MPPPTFRTRLDPALSQALIDLARDWQQPIAAVIRDAVRYAVTHPDIYASEMRHDRLMALASTDTPEQQANAAAYIQGLASYDLAGKLGHDLVT